MTKTAASKSNVTTFTPPKDNLRDAITLLHDAQITGDYRYPALALAGPLISEVGKAFPQDFILIYLVTSYKKRQVWNAYLAKMFADPANPQPITDPCATRQKLMNTSSKELLLEAFGSVPDGYVSALQRLGLDGREPRIYLLLHKFMAESSELSKAFSHASKIDASTVTTLAALPKLLQTYELAKQIKKPEDIKKLTFVIEILTNGDEAKYADLCAKVTSAATRGHSVVAVLKRAYYETPFPEAVLQNTDNCRHISTCADLHKASVQFRNCLKQYFSEAIRGEFQYFRWFEINRPVAVISIREDSPFGWRITDMKGKRNEYLDDELEARILEHFEKHGVLNQPSMEKSLNDLSRIFKSEHHAEDPTDHINAVIDDLLNEGDPD